VWAAAGAAEDGEPRPAVGVGEGPHVVDGVGHRAPGLAGRAAVAGPVVHKQTQLALLHRRDQIRSFPAAARRSAVPDHRESVLRPVEAVAQDPSVGEGQFRGRG
jgi:hypothetical protein